MIKKRSRKSELEDAFFVELGIFGVPTPVRQYRFTPKRRWHFDFAWIEQKIAVEIHGGIFLPGTGHNRGRSMELDFEKSNTAQLIGWSVFTFGPSQIRGKKHLTQASPACEFLWKLFRDQTVRVSSECYKKTGKTPPAGNSCLQTPGTCESCPDWGK